MDPTPPHTEPCPAGTMQQNPMFAEPVGAPPGSTWRASLLPVPANVNRWQLAPLWLFLFVHVSPADGTVLVSCAGVASGTTSLNLDNQGRTAIRAGAFDNVPSTVTPLYVAVAGSAMLMLRHCCLLHVRHMMCRES